MKSPRVSRPQRDGSKAMAHQYPAEGQNQLQPPVFQLQASPATDTDTSWAATKQEILSGNLVGQGAYDRDKDAFVNPKLQQALVYCQQHWAPTVDTEVFTPGKGDSEGKALEGQPAWVGSFTQKLAVVQKNAPSTNYFNENQNVAVKSNWNPNKNPLWGEDSTLAQRLVEAFMQDWTKKLYAKNPGQEPGLAEGEIPLGVGALMERIGASETNKRAILLGDMPGEIYGWCGLAAQNGLALGLMKKGLRLKTGKPPVSLQTIPGYAGISAGVQQVMGQLDSAQQQVDKAVEAWQKADYPGKPAELPKWIADSQQRIDKARAQAETSLSHAAVFFGAEALRREVTAQGAYIHEWQKQAQSGGTARGVGGEQAWKADLHAGDIITPILRKSPLSGHVATVIKEEELSAAEKEAHPGAFSKVYYISGNAGAKGGGAVQVEMVYREHPDPTYNWGQAAAFGNELTRRKVAYNQALAAYTKSQTLEPGGWNWATGSWEYVLMSYYWEAYRSYYRDKVGSEPPNQMGQPAGGQGGIDTLHNMGPQKVSMKVKPSQEGHMWVVSILRTSLFNQASGLDLDNLSGEDQQYLEEVGLETLNPQIKAEYMAALQHWENPAGYKP